MRHGRKQLLVRGLEHDRAGRVYRRFGLPGLRRLTEAFGGAFIHCCGTYGRHAVNLAASGIPIRGVEFHHPHTTVEELRPLAERGVVLTPYLFRADAGTGDVFAWYHKLLDTTPWRYAFALFDEAPAHAFARELEQRGLLTP